MKRSVAFALAWVCWASSTAAAPSGSGTPTEDPSPPPRDDIVNLHMTRTWNEGRPRFFGSLLVDAGYLYLRPRVAAGWGKPFQTWVGIEGNPLLTNTGLGAYGGVRIALPYVDLRLGPRFFGAFQHNFMAPKAEFNRLDLDDTTRGKAQYLTLEAELTGSVPLGPGDILGLASVSYVSGVPGDSYVFEETLRVIVKPPMVWRARGGYSIRLGQHRQHSVGLVADVLHVPGRDDSMTVRAGPVLRIVLSRHFEVRGSFVTTIVSPDNIGLIGGDFTELGVRYRIATP